jgi:Ca2+-binding RTX toxin-like protein
MPIVGTDNAETINGTSGDDIIFGLGKNDVLNGFGGNDVLIGGAGADTMSGGTGGDTFEVNDGGDVVNERVGEGTDVVAAQTNWIATPGSEIEFLQDAGSGQIHLTGNLHSNAYSMTITGNNEVSVLDDGGGRADLYGGGGSDVYVVTNALTVVHEFDGTEGSEGGHGDFTLPAPDPLADGYDTVRTNLSSYTLGDNLEKLVYFGSGNFYGKGNWEANDISGGGGDDTLDGGGGNDRMTGGAGNDIYYYDSPGDFAVENASGGIDEIRTTISTTAAPNIEKLTYIGTGGAALYAASTGTSIVGGSGNDKVWGGSGNDTLDGNGGNDILYGGGGTDAFILHPFANQPGTARIVDFKSGVDHLIIDNSPFGADRNVDEVVTFSPPPRSDFPEHFPTQYFFYDQSAGKLYLQHGGTHYDDNGIALPGQAALIATFDNHPSLSVNDFIFT